MKANVLGGPGWYRPLLSHILGSIGCRGINFFGYQQCEIHNLGDTREDPRPQKQYLDQTLDCKRRYHFHFLKK